MKLLIFILNKTEVLDRLLKELADEHLTGATVLNSLGMATQLANSNDETFSSIFGSLRNMLKDAKKDNKTIMMVTKEENVARIEAVIDRVVGDIDLPNTGILFTVPVDYLRGFKKEMILFYLSILLITGLLFGKLAKLLKLPSVTGYLLGAYSLAH